MLMASQSVLARSETVPDASSTLLRIHKLYYQQPPHDTTLYDCLKVAPNATSAQISHSYRLLSRKYHPDKASGMEQEWQTIQKAHDILKEDSTRMPYHQYGLLYSSDAAVLLTGGYRNFQQQQQQQHQQQFFPQQRIHTGDLREKLLNLMGYPRDRKLSYDDRILFLAANLVERMRPWVEGTISTSTWTETLAQEFDMLKKLPLGAQILRCIGRAYRHSGQTVLRQERFKLLGDITNVLRSYKHNTEHLLEAFAVGGKLILTEKQQQQQARSNPNLSADPKQAQLEYDFLQDNDLDENAFHQETHDKAKKIQLELLQIKALWKVSKIHLDRAIHDACQTILDGKYFFYPSHASPHVQDWTQQGDGWVSARGQTITAPVGRLRAASALVLMGNVMVQCAKDKSS